MLKERAGLNISLRSSWTKIEDFFYIESAQKWFQERTSGNHILLELGGNQNSFFLVKILLIF